MRPLIVGMVVLASVGSVRGAAPPPFFIDIPDLKTVLSKPHELALVVQRYEEDRASLSRTYPLVDSPTRHVRLGVFEEAWEQALGKLEGTRWSKEGKEALEKLRKTVATHREETKAALQRCEQVGRVLPFASTIIELEESRRRMEPMDAFKAATRVHGMTKELLSKQDQIEVSGESARRGAEATRRLRGHLRHWFDFYNGYDPLFSWWLAEPYREAMEGLERWASKLDERGKKENKDRKKESGKEISFREGVRSGDVPDLDELMRMPRSEMQGVIRKFQGDRFRVGRLAAASIPAPAGAGRRGERSERQKRFYQGWLEGLRRLDFEKLSAEGQIDYLLLRNQIERELGRLALEGRAERPRGKREGSDIRGRPIGREALEVELRGEMIPYSPEELIQIAEKEFAWCEAEMKKAAREMGFDDWRKALEKVKTLHVEPGKQPMVIRELAQEAIEYLKKHGLVTVPELACETWRMEMMSPRRQLVNPFFTGGEVITVSFPTSTMAHEAKLQSMRGNNIHFSRATVHHELIPGHHLQGFMNARYASYRGVFNTPFWLEGWALYWEMLLYERGFPQKAEDRAGFLFWRMHRCARIVFSLGFHLGKMSPEECIELLVSRVGHERDNATAEVRRSFGGSYPPLYQAAYMLGGMQFWALYGELVRTGKMSARDFHDQILKENRIPVALLRARLTGQKLSREWRADWKFAIR